MLGERTVTHVDVTMVTGQIISGFSVVTSHKDDTVSSSIVPYTFPPLSLSLSLSLSPPLPLFPPFLVSLTLAVIVAPKHTMPLHCHWLVTSHMTGVSADQILGKRGNFFHQDGKKKCRTLMSDPVCVCVCVCVCRRAESLSYCAESLLLIMSGMLGLADSCYRM